MTSVFAGFVIFSTLGFMAHEQGVSIHDVAEKGAPLHGYIGPVTQLSLIAKKLSVVWSLACIACVYQHICDLSCKAILFTYRPWSGVYRLPQGGDADAAASDVGRALLLHDHLGGPRLAGQGQLALAYAAHPSAQPRLGVPKKDCPQFVGVEALTTVMLDMFPQLRHGYRREISIACYCVISFLLGLTMVTRVS